MELVSNEKKDIIYNDYPQETTQIRQIIEEASEGCKHFDFDSQ